MIASRHAPTSSPNPHLHAIDRLHASNAELLAEHPPAPGAVVLLGGTSVVDFRVRVAQSHVRQDLLPSYWSIAGIAADRETFWSVPFTLADPAAIPRHNAVRSCRFEDFADQFHYPNLAVIEFSERGAEILSRVAAVRSQRSIIDLPGLLVAWLGFVWGVRSAGNPLLAGQALPGAALVERAHALSQVALTPGLANPASCPEDLWHAAKWWHDHREAGAPVAEAPDPHAPFPRGFFVLRQPEAAAASTGS